MAYHKCLHHHACQCTKLRCDLADLMLDAAVKLATEVDTKGEFSLSTLQELRDAALGYGQYSGRDVGLSGINLDQAMRVLQALIHAAGPITVLTRATTMALTDPTIHCSPPTVNIKSEIAVAALEALGKDAYVPTYKYKACGRSRRRRVAARLSATETSSKELRAADLRHTRASGTPAPPRSDGGPEGSEGDPAGL